jgi:uncharacterized membrane protein YkoI
MIKFGLSAAALLLTMLIVSCSSSVSPVDAQNEPDQGLVINMDSVIKDPLLDPADSQLVSKEDVLKYIRSLINGDLDKIYQDTVSGIPVWVVIIYVPGEGNVIFNVSLEFNIIINVEINYNNDDGEDDDDKDSDDCREVKFKTQFKAGIKFSEAFDIAKKHHGKGYMIKWKLFYHNDYHWVYMIKMKSDSGYYKIFINAKNGDIIGKFKSNKED